jgi:hypothetical protein
MFGPSKLTAAVVNLANSLNTMAAVVDAASGKLRQHLALDDHGHAGVVIDGAALPAPAEDNGDAQAGNGRGKRNKAAASA